MNLYNKDKTYHRLSSQVYKISKSTKRFSVNLGSSNQNFKIMASRFDQENGFQAMAVSPINGKGKVEKMKCILYTLAHSC